MKVLKWIKTLPDWLKVATTFVALVAAIWGLVSIVRGADLRAQQEIDRAQTDSIKSIIEQNKARDTAIAEIQQSMLEIKGDMKDGNREQAETKKLALLIAKALGVSELKIQAITLSDSTDTTKGDPQ